MSRFGGVAFCEQVGGAIRASNFTLLHPFAHVYNIVEWVSYGGGIQGSRVIWGALTLQDPSFTGFWFWFQSGPLQQDSGFLYLFSFNRGPKASITPTTLRLSAGKAVGRPPRGCPS